VPLPHRILHFRSNAQFGPVSPEANLPTAMWLIILLQWLSRGTRSVIDCVSELFDDERVWRAARPARNVERRRDEDPFVDASLSQSAARRVDVASGLPSNTSATDMPPLLPRGARSKLTIKCSSGEGARILANEKGCRREGPVTENVRYAHRDTALMFPKRTDLRTAPGNDPL